jgi:hypothetical protein
MKHGSRFARGSWRWGCAEEWLGLGEPVRLAYARCKQAQKTLSFYTQGYLILPMTEIVFSRKHVGVLYLLVKIQKTSKVRQGGLKQILQKWKLSD